MLLLGAVFLFTLLATAWLARPGNPLAAQAVPDARSLHVRPTPSGGGLAVVVALLLADLALRSFPALGASTPWLFPHPNLLAATAMLAAISWADDRRPLSAGLRMLVHAGAAFLALGAGLSFGLGLWADAATLLLILWSINLFNFMDGMDGLAGGMAVIGFGALGLLARSAGEAPLALACLMACVAFAGFLIWNFPPARIFLGDVGSAPLGFLAAVFSLWGVFAGAFEAAVPLLIFAPFWVDASSTLGRRLLRGEQVWKAHRTHAYQRLALAGWGHRRTTLAEYALMLACAGAAALYQAGDDSLRTGILVGAGAAFALLVLLVRTVERKNSRR